MNKKVVIAFLFMFLLTISTGVYGVILSNTEPTLFWFAVPAGNITEPKVLRGPGPPINLTPIKVDIDRFTPLKKFFNPNVVEIGTHWIYNYGKKPVILRIELINCTLPVKWDVSANFPFDEKTHTFTKPLMPGQRIDGLVFHWIFEIPPELMNKPIIYQGGVKLIDANTGEVLTFIPIEIVRGELMRGGS
ncbi:MAG: hypothetical protein DSO09_03060 [Candidatus Methanomethylicota archaeon]|jgi:hypothetical protein|uniref:Uncharacterized protein n=1 Tax=Thermoproteota archaeon TaxID=2056631 RepID=A0A523BEF0_9CREN|nr:MAG: hypothetical protein EF809_05680 [Candidatus Verstraetearchaeota archaeon]TDA38840.1 MAG: hypothetical protein DSO09_03060 [Candidatus Verstraetearchaeota archaeon]